MSLATSRAVCTVVAVKRERHHHRHAQQPDHDARRRSGRAGAAARAAARCRSAAAAANQATASTIAMTVTPMSVLSFTAKLPSPASPPWATATTAPMTRQQEERPKTDQDVRPRRRWPARRCAMPGQHRRQGRPADDGGGGRRLAKRGGPPGFGRTGLPCPSPPVVGGLGRCSPKAYGQHRSLTVSRPRWAVGAGGGAPGPARRGRPGTRMPGRARPACPGCTRPTWPNPDNRLRGVTEWGGF